MSVGGSGRRGLIERCYIFELDRWAGIRTEVPMYPLEAYLREG